MDDIAIRLPDEDFWQLVTEEPKAPTERGYHSLRISPRWVSWAKRIILDVSYIAPRGRDGRSMALSLYLCRLTRILDTFFESSPIKRPPTILENLLLGAADIAGLAIELVRAGTRGYGDAVLQDACDAGVVQSEKIDLWHSGMASGSGWETYYSLTLLGKRKADAGNPPPPFRWNEQDDADLAAAAEGVASIAAAAPQVDATPGTPARGSAAGTATTTPAPISSADTDTTPNNPRNPEVVSSVGGETKALLVPPWWKPPPPSRPSEPTPMTAQAASNMGAVLVHNQINIDPGAVADLVAQKLAERQVVPAAKPADTPPADEPGKDTPAGPKPLSDRARTAFIQWQRAVDGLRDEGNESPTDRQCYTWFQKHNESDPLPELNTWQRYLREARRFADLRLNTPRAGREHGSSIITPADVDPNELNKLAGGVLRPSNDDE